MSRNSVWEEPGIAAAVSALRKEFARVCGQYGMEMVGSMILLHSRREGERDANVAIDFHGCGCPVCRGYILPEVVACLTMPSSPAEPPAAGRPAGVH
jgi:hypothetical protein